MLYKALLKKKTRNRYWKLFETLKAYYKLSMHKDIEKMIDENTCPICNRHFKKRIQLITHLINKHESEIYHILYNVAEIYIKYEISYKRHIKPEDIYNIVKEHLSNNLYI